MLSRLLTLALLSIPSALAATTCNGHAQLCRQLYSNVTYIGAHNSYAVGSSVAENQGKDVTAQLNDGIRTLQIQAHKAQDGVHLCHSACWLLDAGLLSDYLSKVASWVKSNPNDAVITLVIVNIDNLPVTSFTSAFESSGLSNKTFTPSKQPRTLQDWPTLSDMIDQGKTVVAFIDNQADLNSVPYLIDEFTALWEDAYDVTDQEFGCAINRSSGTSTPQPYLINHFLDSTYSFSGTQLFVPNKDKLNETNAESGTGSIGFHVDNCRKPWGRNPTYILLDFYDSNGNAPFNLAASLNNVPAPTNTVSVGSDATASSGNSAGVSSKSLNGASPNADSILKNTVLALGLMIGVGLGVGRVLM
nr:hypothetical protein L204_04134 [Cryptococcus depauperatus CBS 7855]